MGGAPFIQVKNVTKRFKKNLVLDNISLEIPYGKVFGIIGKSGCGKTTLLNMIIGFLKPTKGLIYYQSRSIFKDMKNIEMTFGFASQDLSFYDKLTVEENLRYFGNLYGLRRDEIKNRIEELLQLVELIDARKTISDRLSMGMQRRLDIACSMIHNPKVLILDEPTQDLDPILRKEVLRVIKKVNETGTTVIITSHLLDEINYLCDNIAIINDSKIVKVESPRELEEDYAVNSVITIETLGRRYDDIINDVKKIDGIDYIDVDKGRLIVHSPKAERIFNQVLRIIRNKNEKIISSYIGKPSLDDIFEMVVKKK